jgi:FkbM family methyltransferase
MNAMSWTRPYRLVLAQRVCRPLPPLIAQRLRTWLYPYSRAQQDDYQFTVRAQTGSRFCHRTSDFHAYPFSIHGYYEWRNWAVALALCSVGDTIIEIGANIGTETVGFRDIVGESGRVVAFEPLPANCAALRRLVELNGWQNVRVSPLALGNKCDRLRFVTPADDRLSGVGHIAGSGEQGAEMAIEVACATLDSLESDLGGARLLVSDVEGAEAMVLEGAEAYLGRHRPAIVLEASPKLLARAGAGLGQLAQKLEENRYAAWRISRWGLRRVEDSGATHAANWLCLHESEVHLASRCAKALRRCGLLPCVPGLNPLTRGSLA